MKVDSERKPLRTALLIIDMISDWEFEDGEKLFRNALSAAKSISRLKARAASAKVPTVFVNDNYGRWREDFERQIREVVEKSERGRQIVELLAPDAEDYYILKPQRSGFYQTALSTLLRSLEVSQLILTGASTDICVLFTAHDAYMRGYSLVVPTDCCAAINVKDHDSALALLGRVTDADISASSKISFEGMYAT